MAANVTGCDLAVFNSEWIVAFNATYTFCMNAAQQCSDNSNTTFRMVLDPSSNLTTQKQLYYFYSAQPAQDQLVGCMDRTVPGQRYAWAAASTVQTSQGDADSTTRLNRCSGNWSITFLTIILLAFQFLPISTAALISSDTNDFLEKRALSCQKFVPNGTAQSSYTSPQQIGSKVYCANAGSSCFATADPKVPAPAGYSLTISPNTDNFTAANLPTTFVNNSFDASIAQQYSQVLRPSSLVVLSVAMGQEGYLAAYRPADLYEGQLQGCSNGNNYSATFMEATGSFLYNVVLTNEQQ